MTLEELRLTILLDDNYIPKTIEEYLLLPELTGEELLNIKCAPYFYKLNYNIWLYPAFWYNYIPEGLWITDLVGNSCVFYKKTEYECNIITYDCTQCSFGFLKLFD